MIGALSTLLLAGCGFAQAGLGGGGQLVDEPDGRTVDPTLAARVEARCDALPSLGAELQLHATLGGRQASGSVSVRNRLFGVPLLVSTRWPSESLFAVALGAGPELTWERIDTRVGDAQQTSNEWRVHLHGQLGVSARYAPLQVRLMAFARTDGRATAGALLFASLDL